jgi:hypothetical protein
MQENKFFLIFRIALTRKTKVEIFFFSKQETGKKRKHKPRLTETLSQL